MRILGAVFCLLGTLFFVSPVFTGVCHLGMFAPAAALLLLAVWLLWGRSWPRWLRRTLTALYLLALSIVAILLWQMGVYAHNAPIAENEPCTVVVLGCRADHGKPGMMLQNRVDAAYEYLSAHPESYCVCSGGLDEIEEPLTQGEVIREALADMGIDRERLLVDSKSENTRENLSFSAAIIEENQLSPLVAIASDNFHQYRAALYAQQCGLTPFSLGCRSPWQLAPGYYCREMMALLYEMLC